MDDRTLKQIVGSLGENYEPIRELGRGATSIVYLLRDHALGRTVALKVIRGGFGFDDEALGRLEREAHLVARLHHPNIVRLYGTHTLPDGTFTLLMEHVPGRNLKEIIRSEGSRPIAEVLAVLKDVASALAYAHRRRIVHRDVKPENIYIDEEVGSARLADFGVARPWDQDSRLTVPGASLGTPAYMSPEQIDGKPVDGRSDVYSLGLVGYEMIVGRHPWEGENVFTTIFNQKNEVLSLDLPALEPHPRLRAILEKALRKDPEERWPTAGDLLRELRGVVAEAAPGGFGDPSPEPEFPDFSDDEPRGPALEDIDFSGIGEQPPAARGTGADRASDFEMPQEDEPPADSWRELALAIPEEGVVEAAPEGGSAPPERPSTPAGLPVRRARRNPLVWAVPLVVLAASYGFLRWTQSAGEGEASGVPAPETMGPGISGGPGAPGRSAAPSGGLFLAVEGSGEVAGRVGTLVPLAVRVADGRGSPVADTLVSFRVLEGGGTLESESVRTGEDGRAEARLRLPSSAGPGMVEASLIGSDDAGVRFRVSARPGPPSRVSRLIGDGQSAAPGEVLPEYIGVRVWDELGHELAGALVRFQVQEGGGQVSPREVPTDDRGRAFARWVLGSEPGPQAVEAVVAGLPDSVLVFQATADPTSPPPDSTLVEPPPAVVRPIAVRADPFSVGGDHLCRLRRGSPACRGSADRGQNGGRGLSGLAALSSGVSHGCGLDREGVAWCWGANESGQVGDGSKQDRMEAVRVETDVRFAELAAGLAHTCGLDADGVAYCWGKNLNGQLGDGTREDRGAPVRVAGGHVFSTLTAGWNHSCGMQPSGQALCWGGGGDGQLGDGSRLDRLSPVQVPGVYQDLAAGARHTCGIGGGSILCWGDNAFGQLGDGGTESRSSPAEVEGLPGLARTLTAGAGHSCALLAGGAAYCWGQNLYGQLGNGSTSNATSPVAVGGAERFVSLRAGGGVTCGLTADGGEYCWGFNQGGQLGDGTRTNRSTPVRVGG